MKRIWATTRLSLQQLKLVYIITGIAFSFFLLAFLLLYLSNDGYFGQTPLSYTFIVLPLLSAIMVPLFINRRLISFNAKRKDLLINSAVLYAIICAGAALLLIIIRGAVELPLEAKHERFFFSNPFEQKFYWIEMGQGGRVGAMRKIDIPLPILFFQQFFFFYLICTACHMLVSLQKNWIGWALDVIIITAILVINYVMVDINYLSESLLDYLKPTIDYLFFGKAYIQIPIAIGLSAIISFFNIIITKYQKFL